MRLVPEEVARHFGIADEEQLSRFDPSRNDLGTGNSRRALDVALLGKSKDELSAFWTQFANAYIGNLVRAWTVLLASKPRNINTLLFEACIDHPQFSRFIREHPDGRFVLPMWIERFNDLCPKADDLRFNENDSFSCYRAEVIAHQVLAVILYLLKVVHHSPPSVTLTSLPSSAQTAAAALAIRLQQISSVLPKILAQHSSYFATPKAALLKMGLRDSLDEIEEAIAYLRGTTDPGRLRSGPHAMIVCWWDCEVSRERIRAGGSLTEMRCSKANLLKCSRCDSVTYCSPEDQKEHWEVHKLECVKPAW